MKIIDCFIYNNEDLILDLRLNCLNEYIDKFVIIEAKFNHSGSEKKKYNFKIENFTKFKNKIEYLQLDNFPENLTDWGRENFHRNYILKGLSNINDDDLVIISDVDEIPNLENFDKIQIGKKKFTAFRQKFFYYKFNLLNITDTDWYGSKMCRFKDLKSPQWLRNKRVKNYPFYRIDKIKWNIVDNGGWHFSFIMTPDDIREKIKSFAHSELNLPEFTDVKMIRKKIESKEDLFNRNYKFKIIEDKELPEYIKINKGKFSQFLL
tara:strand:- start:1967 stop:2758 length:792 start_codon:yes stop_codon:yes gene_type:complete